MWTFRNEGCYQAIDFRSDPASEFAFFRSLGIDGAFCDDPEGCLRALRAGHVDDDEEDRPGSESGGGPLERQRQRERDALLVWAGAGWAVAVAVLAAALLARWAEGRQRARRLQQLPAGDAWGATGQARGGARGAGRTPRLAAAEAAAEAGGAGGLGPARSPNSANHGKAWEWLGQLGLEGGAAAGASSASLTRRSTRELGRDA